MNEKEILKEFENDGWEITKNDKFSYVKIDHHDGNVIYIEKKSKFYTAHGSITLKIHLLIHELLKVWGIIKEKENE